MPRKPEILLDLHSHRGLPRDYGLETWAGLIDGFLRWEHEVARNVSCSEPTRYFQHHGQGSAAVLRKSVPNPVSQAGAPIFCLGPQIPEKSSLGPWKRTGVGLAKGKGAREPLNLQDPEDPATAKAGTNYFSTEQRALNCTEPRSRSQS